jgi:hypothetical protein
VAQGVDQGKGYPAFAQVREDGFAQQLFLAPEIEHVVDDLKGQAQVASVVDEPPFLLPGGPAQDGSDLAGGREERGRFFVDDVDVVLLACLQVSALMVLGQFALDHAGRDLGQDADDFGMSAFLGQPERPDIEVIAEQDGYVGSPPGVDGIASPSQVGVIDDIIVDQAGGMDELDQRRHEDMFLTAVAQELGAQDEKGGPDPLALLLEEICADFGDQPVGGSRQYLEAVLNPSELPLDMIIDVIEVLSLAEEFARFLGHKVLHR